MKKVFLVLAVMALVTVSCKKAEVAAEAPVADTAAVQVDSVAVDTAVVDTAAVK